jgi:hypothetical protein
LHLSTSLNKHIPNQQRQSTVEKYKTMKSRTTQLLNWAFCFMVFFLGAPIVRAATVSVEVSLNTDNTTFQSSTGSPLNSFTMQIGWFSQTPTSWGQVTSAYLASNFNSIGATASYTGALDYSFSGSIPTSGDLRAYLVIKSSATSDFGIFNWSTALDGPVYLLSTDDSNGSMYVDTGVIAPIAGLNRLPVISPLAGSVSGANGSAILKLASTSTSQAQTITFNEIPSKSVGDSFDLSASATSGLAVTFESSNPAVTILGNRVTINGVGSVTITAKQAGGIAPGGVSFSSATVSQTFTSYPSTSLKVSSFGTPTYSAVTGQTSVTHLFTGNPNALYAIEYKTDLAAANWTPLLSPVQTNTGSFQVTINVAGDVTSNWKNKFFIRARNS